MLPKIPTHLIMGFMGAGKSTLIRQLLQQQPAHASWALLINDFGAETIGPDLALPDRTLHIREVPGGCMCCSAGLPLQVTLNQIISRDQPDRLFIELHGAGHHRAFIQRLTESPYPSRLQLQPTVCLLDPQRLADPRVMAHAGFRDQLALAERILINKADTCDTVQAAGVTDWLDRLALTQAKRHWTTQAAVELAWLMASD